MDRETPQAAHRSGQRATPQRRWLGQVRARVWLLALALLLAAVSAGAALALATRPSSDRAANATSAFGPAATWAPGVKAAPDFSLRSEGGRRISVAPDEFCRPCATRRKTLAEPVAARRCHFAALRPSRR